MRIVVTGLIGSIPLAGLTLHYLQYVLGFKALGYDVLYLEDTGTWCYDPSSDGMVQDSSASVKYLTGVMSAYDHADGWAFVDHQNNYNGMTKHQLDTFLASAEIFINVTGAGLLRDSYLRIPSRIYIDTDPGFVQLRLARGSTQDKYHLGLHTSHHSFGCNIGQGSCTIPTDEFHWIPTVQPICLDLWPYMPADPVAPFTTIMKWKSYPPEEYEGKTYGLKDLELKKYIDLPGRISHPMELAISGNPPESDLKNSGWSLRNALDISYSIEAYRQYIQKSLGEWSIAKNAYVSMYSGWFSERSACYMASGRPVVVQETGFSEWMKTGGLGVKPFSNVDEASEAIDNILANYLLHSRAARDIAHEYFSAEIVLSNLIESSNAR
jgi:hypothetical protein